MRVLFFSTDFPPKLGGVAALSLEQCVNLARAGHKVRVETLEFGALPEVCKTTPRLDVRANRVEQKPVKRLIPFSQIVWHGAREFSPDVFYASTHRGFGLPMALCAWQHAKPYAIYVHGSEILTELPSPARRMILRRMLFGAGVLITNSENTKRLLTTHFPGLRRIEVIHPGIDQTRLAQPGAPLRAAKLREQWLREKQLPENTVVLLSLCRLSRQKGIGNVLQALSDIRVSSESVNEWLYVIAGSGPDEKEFRDFVVQKRLEKQVLFLGQVPYGETAATLHAADIYVQPSQPLPGWLESFGISFVEAEFCGLPCIATRFGGIPEAVRDGETAILVEPGDDKQLARAILELVNNRERRIAMGHAAKMFAARFSWEAHAQRLAEVLEACCHSSLRS